VTRIVGLLDAARKSAARSVNSIMTATYWEIGRRIIQIEQSGQAKADYGAVVVEKLVSAPNGPADFDVVL
jgi:hypothetical protein